MRGQFFSTYTPVIDALLQSPNVRMRAVHFEEDPDVVIGWAASEVRDGLTCIHFVYVKRGEELRGARGWRKRGIARALLDDAGANGRGWICTFLTSQGLEPYGGRFRPFFIRDYYAIGGNQ